jgi:cell division septation protein DedD
MVVRNHTNLYFEKIITLNMRGIGEAESKYAQDFYNRECHIIGIGIDKYKDKKWTELSNCKKDVDRFIEKSCLFFKTFKNTPECIERLYDEKATKENIKRVIETKLYQLGSHQNLIIYFACHGDVYDKKGYIAPWEAKTSYTNPNGSNLISYKEVFKWFDNKTPHHILLILDVCHSGSIFNTKRAKYDELDLDLSPPFKDQTADLSRMMRTKSAWVITSGSGEESVKDGGESGSPFSIELMKFMDAHYKTQTDLNVTLLGAFFKRFFNPKIDQNPNFGHLRLIEGYSDLGGEFVFEPKPLKKVNSESTTSKSPNEYSLPHIKDKLTNNGINESQKRPYKPSNTEGVSIGKDFFDGKPLYPQTSSTPTNYSNTASKPTKSHFKYWASLILISIPLLLLYLAKKAKSKDRPDPNVEITTVLPPSAILDGGIHTWHPPPVDKTTTNPPITETEPPKSVNTNDTITKPKDDGKDSGIANPNEATTSIDGSVGTNPSVGSKGIATQKDKNGKPINPNDYSDINKGNPYNEDNTLNERPNLVFVGSFENKANAEGILERLRKIGYQDAEIIMKENMPYAVVVTGFYQHKSSAKAEVKAIRKRGFEVYYAKADLTKIYRQRE